MTVLDYKRHFVLLACMAAVLAAVNRETSGLGAAASFGVYGACHALAVALTLKAPTVPWRRAVFVGVGSCLSLLSVSFCVYASRIGGPLPGLQKPALLLMMASGFGAVSYAALLRACFAPQLSPAAIASVALGCVVATLGVLEFGLYLYGGGLCFAVVWWFAFSWGLRYQGGRQAAGSGIH